MEVCSTGFMAEGLQVSRKVPGSPRQKVEVYGGTLGKISHSTRQKAMAGELCVCWMVDSRVGKKFPIPGGVHRG